MAFLEFFKPNIFSPTGTLVFVLVALCYWRGLRQLKADGKPVKLWRILLFYGCWGAAYIALETQFDYFGEFIFFMHRIQHMILHHLASFFIIFARPFPVLNAGLGKRFPRHWLIFRLLGVSVRWLMRPMVASILFAGLIAVWLYKPVHLASMLNYHLYLLMNWSMLVDGLLFWAMMLDEDIAAKVGASGYGKRMLGLVFIIAVQVVVGAYITFAEEPLYHIYAVCGRIWQISPMVDQQLGGIMTWIPPSMMMVFAALILFQRYLRFDEERARQNRQLHRQAMAATTTSGKDTTTSEES